jgi:putative spermidine/putrescine transport system substrate-binding protein
MKKIALYVSSFALLSCAYGAQADQITVVGWGGTWDKAYKEGVWDPYSRATGAKIILEEWGGEIAKVRAQVQSGSITYDVVSVEAPAMEVGCAEGLFVPLSPEVTGDPAKYHPGTLHECGVASDTWATILAYSKDAIPGDGPKSWADYFDTAKFPGKRGMLAGAQYTLENALMGDGVAPADVYKVLATPEGIDRAFKKLDSIKSDVVWWTSTTQAVQNLASGEVVMTDQYNARITNEIEAEKKNYAIVWDAGFLYGTDFWAIVKGSPNEKAGIELLKWFSQPENQAGFSKLYAYGTGRVEAADFIPAEQLAKLPTSPEHKSRSAAYDNAFWAENKEALEARFKAWLEQ